MAATALQAHIQGAGRGWRTACAALLLGAAALLSGVALALVPVPPLTALVTDQTRTLSAEQAAALEQRLRAFEAERGSQVAVLIVPTTDGEPVEAYALRVVEQWKLGRKKVDDGVLLLVAKDDRTLRIEVGYGLEGAVNDATAKRLIEEQITPRFKAGDFAGGIDAGVNALQALIRGEALPAPPSAADVADDPASLLPVLLVSTFVFGGILRQLFGRGPAAGLSGLAVGALTWWLTGALLWALGAGVVALVLTLIGRLPGGRGGPGGGGWGGGGRGGGGRGGGGGFGGGGGGGFGGGGASGRW